MFMKVSHHGYCDQNGGGSLPIGAVCREELQKGLFSIQVHAYPKASCRLHVSALRKKHRFQW